MELTHQPLFTRKNVVHLSAAFRCLLWGSAYPAIKSGYEIFRVAMDDTLSKIVSAGYHFLFMGSLLLLLVVAQCKPTGQLSPHQYDQLTLLGLTQTSLQYIFFYTSLTFTTGVKGSIMNATGTFFSVLLAHFIYHNDELSYNKAPGCILGLTGVMAVSFSSGMDFSSSLLRGGSVVMAAFILSAATLYGKHISQTVGLTVVAGYQSGGGGPALAIGDYVFGGTLTVHGASLVAIFGYLTLLSSVAFALRSILFKHDRVGIVAPFNLLIPVSGAALSAIFLDENILEWKYAVVLVLVCSGVWWVNKMRR